jgi:hypothetical protein
MDKWLKVFIQLDADEKQESVHEDHAQQDAKVHPLPALGLDAIHLFHHIISRNLWSYGLSIQHKAAKCEPKKVILEHSLHPELMLPIM